MADQPIRVAHVLGKTVAGGVESFVMNYYRHIDRNKVQFDLIVDADSTYSWREEVEALGGHIFMVAPYQNISKNQADLMKLFQENSYLIVHSHLNSLSIFPLYAAKKAGVPIRIAHSHNTAGKGEIKRNCLKYTLRPFSRIFPTDFCASSVISAKWLFGEKAYEQGKVKLFNYAIEINNFCFDQNERSVLREELNVNDKYVVGHIGRFVSQKNHQFLIKIFYHILQKKSDALLLLLGDGPLLPQIKEEVEKLGISENVRFLGVKKDIHRYYQAMDIFVLPSLYEGLGIVGIEAQAAGLRTIASTAVPKEMMITDLVRFISLDENPETWAKEAISWGNNYTRYNTKEDLIVAGYDISSETKQLENFYSSLLSRYKDS